MIPVCEPTLSGNELEYVTDCLKTNWISSGGKYLKKFEEAFASYCGASHCVACCNGTAALHLALAAVGVGPGDEVVIPSFAMIAVCNAVMYTGATPVLVDSERDTWNMDVPRAINAFTGKTRAVVAMHTYGHPVDMDPLMEAAAARGITVIEDAAEAHGAEYKGRRCGGIGKLAAFSFYGNKILTTGEGGAVVTSDPKIAERIRYFENHCFGEPRFLHNDIGFNYRMTNIQAAIGLAQVEKAGALVEARRRNARLYNELINDIPGVTLPPEAQWAKNVYWMYGILLGPDFPLRRDDAMAALKAKGVDTRAFFHPMHLQPCYSGDLPNRPVVSGQTPVCEELGAAGLYLPSSSHLTEAEITTVAAALREIGGRTI